MRRLPEDGIVLHGYCPPFSEDGARDVMQAVAETLQVPVRQTAGLGKYPSWSIGHTDLPVQIAANPAKPWSEVHVSVLETHLTRYGSSWLSLLFDLVSTCSRARLARTTAAGGVGFVSEAELDGDVAFVDWFQYWGKPIVERWGHARLMAGPFHRVELRSDDACVLMLTAEPDDEAMSRKAAAEYLGIRLRPIFAQVQPGKKVQLPWR